VPYRQFLGSDHGESNSDILLGKQTHYHYAMTANTIFAIKNPAQVIFHLSRVFEHLFWLRLFALNQMFYIYIRANDGLDYPRRNAVYLVRYLRTSDVPP